MIKPSNFCATILTVASALSGICVAQAGERPESGRSLPSAPQPQASVNLGNALEVQRLGFASSGVSAQAAVQPSSARQTQTMEPPSPTAGKMRLTRVDAEQMALKNSTRSRL